MPPRSILKKRAAPVETEEVEEVPASGPSAERPQNEPESESDDEELPYDSDDGESFDETDDEADEDAIREMGEGKQKGPKSASVVAHSVTGLTCIVCAELKHTTLRPTPAPTFSLALNHLLNLPPTASTLAPRNAPPSAHTQRLERRAKNLIRETKANHLARGHVRDVIAGWGARPALPFSQWESASAREFERAQHGEAEGEITETGAEREKRLRRLAQRGVVRLFNAIGAAQGAPGKAERDEAKRRKTEDGMSDAGSIATTSAGVDSIGGKVSRRPNVLGGRGKGEARQSLRF